MSDEEKGSVQDQLLARVRAWLETAAKRLRHNDLDFAELKITVRDPGWDDDGTVMVTVLLEETATRDDIEGRVEGVL